MSPAQAGVWSGRGVSFRRYPPGVTIDGAVKRRLVVRQAHHEAYQAAALERLILSLSKDEAWWVALRRDRLAGDGAAAFEGDDRGLASEDVVHACDGARGNQLAFAQRAAAFGEVA